MTIALPYVEIDAEAYGRDRAGYAKALLSHGPIFRSQRGIEVTSHKLAQEVLRHPDLEADHPALIRALGIANPEVLHFLDTMLLGHGRSPERASIRRAVMRHFGPGAPTLDREGIRAMVDDLFSEAPDGEFDLFAGLCQKLPSRLWLQWFGGPKADAPMIAHLSDTVLVKFARDPATVPMIEAGYLELFAYARARIAEARATPGTTLLHQLLAEVDQGLMTEPELFNFVAMLLEATTDNTSAQMAICIGTLASDPALWARLRAEPALRLPAIHEAIRLTARTVALERVARTDVRLAGHDIAAGTSLYANLTSAHLDPEAFPEPERFDPCRKDPARNLTFGGGNFSCLGQTLALIEIEEVLTKLLDACPGFRLTAYQVASGPFINAPDRLKGCLQ